MKKYIGSWLVAMIFRRKDVISLGITGLLCLVYGLVYLRGLHPLWRQDDIMDEVIGHRFEENYNEMWISQRKALDNYNVSKVFMLSYMRGGSSIGGELYNCDPSATMWYEPGDAFFAYYYGLYHENIPQDDLYFKNFTRRKLDENELQAMTDFYTNKFTCQYERLPAQAMTHYFLSESTAMDSYVACRKKNDKQFYANINKCAAFLKDTCSADKVEISLNNRCPYYIHTTRTFIEQHGANNSSQLMKRWLDVLTEQNSSLAITSRMTKKLQSFVNHGLCVQKIRDGNAKCLHVAISKCLKDTIRVVQVNRMKMEDLEPLILANPDMHVIHYVRDPRAIAVSRLAIRKLTWNPNAKQPISEANFLCQRMRADLKQRRRLELKYPGIITQIKYEDLATDPEITAKRIYSIVGRLPPKRWADFVARNMHSTKTGGAFGISVRNATETTRKWRKKVPSDQLAQINRLCADVIHALGYSL